MVRPILEWGTEVYTPPKAEVFESVQRAALRMIAGGQIHTPIVVLEGDLGACSMKSRMDMRKCALLGKFQMAPSGSLLGQLRDHSQRKCVRGKKVLRDEFERLTREVLRPAGLPRAAAPRDGKSNPLAEWRDRACAQVLAAEGAKRGAQLQKLSSLSLLVDHGTDFSTACAHPYTRSPNGRAASLWFKIRSNTLPLGRLLAKSKKGVSDRCKCCTSAAREDLMHFLCDCPALHQLRDDWLRAIQEEYSESTLALTDIPKIVFGPASALLYLPHESTQDKVSAMEILLTRLWQARNTLHFGSQRDGCAALSPIVKSIPKVYTRGYTGDSRTDTSDDSHRLNAPSSIDTTANGCLTRARARLLLQAVPYAERPSQTDRVMQATDTLCTLFSQHATVRQAQRSRSQRLESMEIISKT